MTFEGGMVLESFLNRTTSKGCNSSTLAEAMKFSSLLISYEGEFRFGDEGEAGEDSEEGITAAEIGLPFLRMTSFLSGETELR